MNRRDTVFVAVVLLSVFLGATAAADYGNTLAARERAVSLSDHIVISVSGVEVSDDHLSFTATIRNPTSATVTATGVYVSVFDGTGDRLAYGSASAFESISMPAGTTHTVQVSVPLTTAQADSLQHVLAKGNGFVIMLRSQMTYDGIGFVVQSERIPTDEGHR